jgi:hypothetical protein
VSFVSSLAGYEEIERACSLGVSLRRASGTFSVLDPTLHRQASCQRTSRSAASAEQGEAGREPDTTLIARTVARTARICSAARFASARGFQRARISSAAWTDNAAWVANVDLIPSACTDRAQGAP